MWWWILKKYDEKKENVVLCSKRDIHIKKRKN